MQEMIRIRNYIIANLTNYYNKLSHIASQGADLQSLSKFLIDWTTLFLA